MSDISDISNGLLNMEDELKSLKEIIESVEDTKKSAEETIQTSSVLNGTAQVLTENVQKLVKDIHNLGLEAKIDLLSNLTGNLRTEVDSTSSQITSLGVNFCNKLDGLDTKLNLLTNATTSLQAETNSVSSQITVFSENTMKVLDHLEAKLDDKIEALKAETHDGMIMLNGEIKGRIDAFEGVIERLKHEANSNYQLIQLENKKINKILLILTIFGSLGIVMLAIMLFLNLK